MKEIFAKIPKILVGLLAALLVLGIVDNLTRKRDAQRKQTATVAYMRARQAIVVDSAVKATLAPILDSLAREHLALVREYGKAANETNKTRLENEVLKVRLDSLLRTRSPRSRF